MQRHACHPRLGDQSVQDLLRQGLTDRRPVRPFPAVHEVVAAAAQADQVGGDVVDGPPPVSDVVHIPATVGGPAPPAPPLVTFDHFAAQFVGEPLVHAESIGIRITLIDMVYLSYVTLDAGMDEETATVLADTEHMTGVVTFLVGAMAAAVSLIALVRGDIECIPLAFLTGGLWWLSSRSFDASDQWDSEAARIRDAA